MSAGAAFRAEGPDRRATTRIGQLFLLGATLFAIGSVPLIRDGSATAAAAILFAGSIFFTGAAAEQLRTSESDRLDITAAWVQLTGTIFFNLNTFASLDQRLDVRSVDFLVWVPNATGSICFLVCSWLAWLAVRRQRSVTRNIARLNLLGSVAFGASAVAGFVEPDTASAVNASLAAWATLIGAICFAIAAWLLIPRRAAPDDAPYAAMSTAD
jgi:hypothetical protein